VSRLRRAVILERSWRERGEDVEAGLGLEESPD
jgi:hypothetical protein